MKLLGLFKSKTGKSPAKNDVERLTEELRNKDEGARLAAIKALGETGDPRAIEPLINQLKMPKFR